jgi:GT2 family glycosyltransferase
MERAVTRATVAISTRNRGTDVRRAVASVFSSDYPDFAVVVVDQSDDDRTFEAVCDYLGRPDFLYLRSARRGVAAGRNQAIAAVDCEYIAMTDDDCEVSPSWLGEIVAGLRRGDGVGLVFGAVAAAPHDARVGFIPSFSLSSPVLATSIREKHLIEGIGASMGVRRSVWRALGGFDESFGAGARYHSAEELDFAVRTLLRGFAVYATPAAWVTHHGFRPWGQGRRLVWGYLYGIGATFAKALRAGEWRVASLLCRLAWRWAFQQPVVDLGHTPSRLLRLRGFASGFAAALRAPSVP